MFCLRVGFFGGFLGFEVRGCGVLLLVFFEGSGGFRVPVRRVLEGFGSSGVSGAGFKGLEPGL